MANFFLDNKDLQFHMNHPLMKKIVELKEKGYADKDAYDYAPVDFEDAQDSYRRVMEIVGEVCGDVIAPNAEGVDHDGPKVVNDHVEYAPGTARNIEALRQAGLFGLTLPRKYEGLNFPLVYFVMANEMVARADAGFENIWGLQDCAETLNEFASEELKAKYLPRVSRGETCAMDLTEPDAGSDLQAVMLKAHWDETKGTWLLNGVKRFITNGDGHISLVLARSEEGTTDARGLSMFVYDRSHMAVKVRRIENKLGIKGSPTCELVFTNAPAELVGDRKMGAHQVRDVADERRPSGYRCPVDRSFGGRLPRSAQVCAGAHAVRQADHRVPGRGRDAVEHESQTLRFARDAVRDDAFRRDIQGLYSPEP